MWGPEVWGRGCGEEGARKTRLVPPASLSHAPGTRRTSSTLASLTHATSLPRSPVSRLTPHASLSHFFVYRLRYLSHEQYPGPRHATDAELDEYIFKTVHSGNALVGTCKMGTSVSDGSVVSSKDLRVFGISNLVVADSSVIPRIPGGQTGAPAVMVAERAAALLRGTATIGGGSSRAPVAV